MRLRPGSRMRLKGGWLLMAIVLSLGASSKAQDPVRYFPELVFLPRDKEVNSIIDDMTSVHLRAMKEPSLWRLSQNDRDAESYRFLWLATHEHPICIRLKKAGGDFELHVAAHDGPPGLTAGRLTLNKNLKLNPQQAGELIKLFEKTKFWTLPVEVKENGGADGDRIVVEGVKNGKYHVTSRAGIAAGESQRAFCRALIELANEPKVLKAWDRFRVDDRTMPDYLPNPPQTEDLGEPDRRSQEDGVFRQSGSTAAGASSGHDPVSVQPKPTRQSQERSLREFKTGKPPNLLDDRRFGG